MAPRNGGKHRLSASSLDAIIAYLAAIGVAALVFFVSVSTLMIAQDTVALSLNRILERLAVSVFFTVLYLACAVVLAFWPAYATHLVYRRYRINSIAYFVVCGILATAVAVLLFFQMTPTGSLEALRPFPERLAVAVWLMGPPSIFGTVAFGLLLRRQDSSAS